MRKSLRNLGALVSAACVWQAAGVAQASNSDALDWCTPYPQQCFNCDTIYAKLNLNNCIQFNNPAFPFRIKLNGIDITRYAVVCGTEVRICLRKDRGLNINSKQCCHNNRFNTLYAEGYEEVTNEKFTTVVFFTVSKNRVANSATETESPEVLDISGTSYEPTAVQKSFERGWYIFTDLMNQASELEVPVSTTDEMGPPADVVVS